jgi:hypothetical protein
MATKFLQLHVNSLECVRITKNRQEFLGIPLETDPDSIEVATTLTDGQNGVVVNYSPVFLGNRFRDGIRETYVDKVICEVAVQDDDIFPRRVAVALAMAEKDDGGGFQELTDRVANELAENLTEYVQREVDAGDYEQVLTESIGNVAVSMGQEIFRAIGNALGLGDDPFLPQTLIYEIPSYNSQPSMDQVVLVFKEPHASHNGEFRMYCNWHVSNTSAFLVSNANSSGSTGVAVAPLVDQSSNPYVNFSGLRAIRFARPVRKRKLNSNLLTAALRPVKIPILGSNRWFWVNDSSGSAMGRKPVSK